MSVEMCTNLWFSYRRLFAAFVYSSVILMQMILWPTCEDGDSGSLMEDLENDIQLDAVPLPSNLLDPPMWSHDKFAVGQCGSWQKAYTDMHRAMISGDLPPSYLIYTTGNGFPPVIQGIPQALRGLGTVFMLALLTERAFILDWNFPSGFNRVFAPHYIDWRYNIIFENDIEPILHVHDIGSINWFQAQNRSIEFYTKVDFNVYFSNEREVIQSHSYDFTYALLRNRHFKKKILKMGLHTTKCRLCCFWNYLFKYSSSFTQNVDTIAKKKLKLSPRSDLVFIDFSIPRENLPKKILLQQAKEILKCVQVISKGLHDPVYLMASNSYYLLTVIPKLYPKVQTHSGLFFSRERYQVELQQYCNSTEYHSLKAFNAMFMVPRTEHNALIHFFIGYSLQLNSTVLVTNEKSLYSKNMAALRNFYHSSGRYIVYTNKKCKLENYL